MGDSVTNINSIKTLVPEILFLPLSTIVLQCLCIRVHTYNLACVTKVNEGQMLKTLGPQ